jgi:uncharacterized protein with HEPN domain
MTLDKDKVYIQHILECIDKINQYTDNDKDRFISDNLVQDGVLRRLQTMAESTQFYEILFLVMKTSLEKNNPIGIDLI